MVFLSSHLVSGHMEITNYLFQSLFMTNESLFYSVEITILYNELHLGIQIEECKF